MKILIGTNNPSKLRELSRYFVDMDVVCLSPADLSLRVDAPESAGDVAGNAVMKARAWYRASRLPVLTLDSGLTLSDLAPDDPDQPGVQVRRLHGRVLNDDEMLAHYASLIRRHGGTLHGVYQNALCLLANDMLWRTFVESPEEQARRTFILTDRPCAARHPGWPLDSLSIHPATGRYFAEMTPADFAAADGDNGLDTGERVRWLRGALASLGLIASPA